MKTVFKATLIILISTVFGFSLLCFIYTIPSEAYETAHNELQLIMENETPGLVDARFFTYAYGSKNMPDTFIHRLSGFNNSDPLLYKVVGGDDEGDNRYWDGFMVILIPLMTFLSFGQIRFFFTFADIILIWYILVKSYERLPRYFSFAFATGLVLINMLVNFYSPMLNMIFLVAFGFMAYFLKTYTPEINPDTLFYVFLLDGILTTYLDRYTASLISLEMPLLVIVLINMYKYGADSLKRNLKNIIYSVIGWVTGFSFFWLNKWIISSIVLKKNTLYSAFHQACGRAMTNASEMQGIEVENVGGRWFTLAKNIASLLPTHGENVIAVISIFLIAFFIMIVLFIIKKGRWSEPKKYLPLLCLMIMPYIYYFIFSDLNQVHATFYMYRMQLPVIIGFLMIYFDGLNNQSI